MDWLPAASQLPAPEVSEEMAQRAEHAAIFPGEAGYNSRTSMQKVAATRRKPLASPFEPSWGDNRPTSKRNAVPFGEARRRGSNSRGASSTLGGFAARSTLLSL